MSCKSCGRVLWLYGKDRVGDDKDKGKRVKQ